MIDLSNEVCRTSSRPSIVGATRVGALLGGLGAGPPRDRIHVLFANSPTFKCARPPLLLIA
jgi:hypothetical protein